MSDQVRVYARRGRSESDAIRSRTSVNKHSSKESDPLRPDSRHRLPTAAFNEPLCDTGFSKKEFQDQVRSFLLKKQSYTPPVFDPELAHAYALSKKADTLHHHQERAAVNACNTDNFQVLPENTGIPYEFRIPEFYNRLSCSGDGTDVTISPKDATQVLGVALEPNEALTQAVTPTSDIDDGTNARPVSLLSDVAPELPKTPHPGMRSLLIVCPRVPPILRYLGTDQATLNLSYQTGSLTQFTELRQGELIPGLYARVQVPVGVELKFKYCLRLNDGHVAATEDDVQIAQNRGLDADREVYYITPKLVPVKEFEDDLEELLDVEDISVEGSFEGMEYVATEEKTRRAGLIRRLLEAIRRLLRHGGKN